METWGSSGDEITLLELNQFDSAENELNLMLDCASDAAVTTSTESATYKRAVNCSHVSLNEWAEW